jgi:bifunctional DNA-binding transcriptional regulator/antitoxin component of YhaV-PrlF toxin-antitoxin module
MFLSKSLPNRRSCSTVEIMTLTLDQNGKIEIPKALQQALDVEPGGEVYVQLEQGKLILSTLLKKFVEFFASDASKHKVHLFTGAKTFSEAAEKSKHLVNNALSRTKPPELKRIGRFLAWTGETEMDIDAALESIRDERSNQNLLQAGQTQGSAPTQNVSCRGESLCSPH